MAAADPTRQSENSPYHVDLEVSGSELPLLRLLLNRIKLSSEIKRVRIEIDSASPIAPELDTEQVERDDDHEEVADDDRDDVETHSHIDAEPENGDDESPAFKYLNELNQSGPSPDPEDFLTVPLNTDTSKWYVAGTLFRAQGKMTTEAILEKVEGTEWEMTKSSVYNGLHNLKKAGLVDSEPMTGKNHNKHEYQLTQFGRDLMQQRINEMPGYGSGLASLKS